MGTHQSLTKPGNLKSAERPMWRLKMPPPLGKRSLSYATNQTMKAGNPAQRAGMPTYEGSNGFGECRFLRSDVSFVKLGRARLLFGLRIVVD